MNTIRILVAVWLLGLGSAQAATVTFDPNPESVSLNDIFSLDIVGQNFLSVVDGGGVDFTFDKNVVNVLSVSIDLLVWDFFVQNGTIDNLLGTVDGIAVNALSNVGPGNFTVATVQFQAVGVGTTSLVLSEYALNTFASGGSPINPSFSNGSVTVLSAVPIPGAVWLFGSGLFGLISVARKHNNA